MSEYISLNAFFGIVGGGLRKWKAGTGGGGGKLGTAKPLVYSGHPQPIIAGGEESSGGDAVSPV